MNRGPQSPTSVEFESRFKNAGQNDGRLRLRVDLTGSQLRIDGETYPFQTDDI